VIIRYRLLICIVQIILAYFLKKGVTLTGIYKTFSYSSSRKLFSNLQRPRPSAIIKLGQKGGEKPWL